MSFLPQGSTPQTSSYTCNTCGIKFAIADLQRQHMRTEWHRYNLKRRVAGLPSILSDIFAEKILQQEQRREDEEAEEDEFGFFIPRRNKHGVRQPTKKSLKQQAKFAELNRGRKLGEGLQVREESPSAGSVSEFSEFSLGGSSHIHTDDESILTGSGFNYSASEDEYTELESVGALNNEEEEEEDSDSEEEAEMMELMPINHCFFCSKNNGSELENNVRHMFNVHGLYIPERTFLTNLEGLLTYLSEMITFENECLVCGFEGKNLESIRQHVQSKGHCKIPYDTKEEKAAIAEFYDFTIANSSDNKKPSKQKKSVAFESDSDEVLVNIESNDSNDVDSENSQDDPNDNYSVVHVDRSGVELTLPTGARIGHRTMTRYYRQNLPGPRDTLDGERTTALVDKRFAPGITSYEISKQEKDTQQLVQKNKNIAVRRDKLPKVNYQKHYRDELLQ